MEGRYELEAQLGAGGTARVFRARDLITKASVAIKIMEPGREQDPEAVAFFGQEGRLAARIRDPHLVPALHFGIDNGRHFIVYDYLPGSAPLSELAENGRVAPRRVCDMALQILSALDTLHRAGVVHGDVSLNNCLWREREGHRDEVRLCDLGCAWVRLPGLVVSGGPTAPSDSRGTPYYTAPEIMSEEAGDHRADLWSVGAMMYALLTMREVDLGEPDEPLMIAPPALLVPTIPQAISDVVMRALATADQRYPSAATMAEAIRSALVIPPPRRGVPLWASVGGMVFAAAVATLTSLASTRTAADVPDLALSAGAPATEARPLAASTDIASVATPAAITQAPAPTLAAQDAPAPAATNPATVAKAVTAKPAATAKPVVKRLEPQVALTWATVEKVVRGKAQALRSCSSEKFISLGLRVANRRATLESLDGAPVALPDDHCVVDVVSMLRFGESDTITGVVGVKLPPDAVREGQPKG